MHIFAICKKRQNSEKIWYYDNPQKLGEVYFLKSKNVTKCPQKNSFRKKKKKKTDFDFDSDAGKSQINPIECCAYTKQQ